MYQDCAKVLLLSLTEGEDKPLKYPLMFQVADLLLINKTDLLPFLDINIENLKNNVLKVKSNLKIFEISASKEKNIKNWIKILDNWRKNKKND
jgi:hydrogenase nickel incorporation protein HypB